MSTSPQGRDGGSDERTARAEALVHELQVANAQLRAELEVARADVESLQNTLGDVTPLHRHVVRDVKRRLGRGDSRMRAALAPRAAFVPPEAAAAPGAGPVALLDAAGAADRAAAAAWARQPTSSPALRAYQRVSHAAYDALRRLLAAVKQRLR